MQLNKNILCVDDNEDTCHLVTFAFQSEGYEVESAKTPVEGIRLARINKYAAIITDYYLNGMDGVDLCRVIRTFNKTTPIIFFTGEARADKKKAALEAGAQEYIIKPADFDRLAQIVLKIINNQETKGILDLSL